MAHSSSSFFSFLLSSFFKLPYFGFECRESRNDEMKKIKNKELVTTKYPPSLDVRFPIHSKSLVVFYLSVDPMRILNRISRKYKKIFSFLFFSFPRRTYLAKTEFLKQSQMICSPGIFTLELCLIRVLLVSYACMCGVLRKTIFTIFSVFRLLSFHFHSSFAIVIIIIKCNGLQL